MVNLPNAITIGRIAMTPFVALLPFVDSWELRLLAFVLFIVAAVTDYYDGMLARSRNLVTTLGQLLDPLADKLLLVGTLVPMFLLAGGGWSSWGVPPLDLADGAALGPVPAPDGGTHFPFVIPFGRIGLPWWVLAVVLGRELFMTLFRQTAARRGVIIAAIGPAKWKTGFQSTWVGAAYFWFFAATLAAREGWTGAPWRAFAYFNGIVATVTMFVATALTLYSLWLYMRDYGWILRGSRADNRA
ncbi:MAG TPA: CDP-alcohol phosphatidyltransferase family protein [Gemmatimonadales bacterium]